MTYSCLEMYSSTIKQTISKSNKYGGNIINISNAFHFHAPACRSFPSMDGHAASAVLGQISKWLSSNHPVNCNAVVYICLRIHCVCMCACVSRTISVNRPHNVSDAELLHINVIRFGCTRTHRHTNSGSETATDGVGGSVGEYQSKCASAHRAIASIY